MPSWFPTLVWEGQDAYIIGGGPSLRVFNWNLIRGKNTIGCNTAYTLGEDICKICAFGDSKFFQTYKDELAQFKGLVVTCIPTLAKRSEEWLKVVPRRPRGLHTDAVGWNTNTGAMALNLALLLGVKRVFLLGYDMQLVEGRPNWHDRFGKTRAEVYLKFLATFDRIAKDLAVLFPGREVFNVTDDSRLEVFPKVSLRDHFGKETEI